MTNVLTKIFEWVLLSSANPEEVSLTIKGALLGVVPAIMFAAGVAHLNLGQDTLTSLFDSLVAFVQAALTVVSTGVTLYGAIRKLWLTVFKPAQA